MKTLLLTLLFISNAAIARTGGIVIPPVEKPRERADWHEADYVNHHCKGEIEHVLSDKTRIDCLNDDYAIEYDWGKKWAEALGQSLYYSAMTGKKAGIVLIVNKRTKDRYLKRLNKAIESHGLDVTVWTIDK